MAFHRKGGMIWGLQVKIFETKRNEPWFKLLLYLPSNQILSFGAIEGSICYGAF